MKKKIPLPFIISFTFLVLFFTIIFCFNGFVFFINDDKTISEIISGERTGIPSNLAIFVSQVVSYPLMLLYKTFPYIPWYGITFILVCFVSLLTIGTCLINVSNKKKLIDTSIIFVALIGGLFAFHIVNLQFTVVAILPMIAVITLLYKYPKNKSIIIKTLYYLLILFLCTLSCAIRQNSFFLSIPYIGLVLLIKLLKSDNKKEILLHCLLLSLMLIISFGLNAISNNIVISNDKDYQDTLEYCRVRSELDDVYGYPRYEEATELYQSLGIDKSVYILIKKNMLYDLEEFDYNTLVAIRNYQKQHYSFANRLKKFAISVSDTYLDTNIFETLITIICIIIILLANKKNKLTLFFVLNLVLGTILISFILAITLKLPERVVSCLLLLENISLITFGFNYINYNISDHTSVKFFKCFIIYLIIIASLSYSIIVCEIRKYYIVEKHTIQEHINKNNEYIYILDLSIATEQTENVLYKPYRTTNLIYGGWNSKSSTFNQIYKNFGYNSLNEILQNSQHTKLIVKNKDQSKIFDSYVFNKYSRHFILNEDENLLDFYIYDLI